MKIKQSATAEGVFEKNLTRPIVIIKIEHCQRLLHTSTTKVAKEVEHPTNILMLEVYAYFLTARLKTKLWEKYEHIL